MVQCIWGCGSTKEEAWGVSRGSDSKISRAWWWNDEAIEEVRKQVEAHTVIGDGTYEREKEASKAKYRIIKKEAKKAVTFAKNEVYEKLYKRLETKDIEKDVFQTKKKKKKNIKKVVQSVVIK